LCVLQRLSKLLIAGGFLALNNHFAIFPGPKVPLNCAIQTLAAADTTPGCTAPWPKTKNMKGRGRLATGSIVFLRLYCPNTEIRLLERKSWYSISAAHLRVCIYVSVYGRFIRCVRRFIFRLLSFHLTARIPDHLVVPLH
jgi:hypothetical protein